MGKWLALLLLVSACGGGSSSPWEIVDLPGDSEIGSTYSLWVFDDDDVWLGGAGLWHHDGASFTEVELPGEQAFIGDFWGFSPDDLWAVSHDRVFRWDGSAWSEVPPTEGVPFESLLVIWGASPTDVWIANGDNSKVYHYDGTTWTRETLQFVQAAAMWGNRGDDVWLTGPFDTYHYDGTGWSVYEPIDFGPEPRGAYAMWGAASDDVWASSNGFVHWDGNVWTETEAEEEYNSMWGFAPDDIWAVGNRGAMAHYDGSSWTETSGHLTLQQNFTHIHGSSADNLWATAVDFDTLSGFVLRLDP